MGLIQPVAFLWLCENCGEHGKIVLSDKTESPPFLSKEAGFSHVRSLFEKDKLSKEEADVIKGQIDVSGLADEMTALDLVLLGMPLHMAEGMGSDLNDSEGCSEFPFPDTPFIH